MKTTLDGVDQTEYLSRAGSEKSARDTFFYYSGKKPSAVRYKNWKIYFTMVSDNPAGGFILPARLPITGPRSSKYQARPVRDRRSGSQYKTLMGMGGTIGSPSTAYVYDWNMLPIGQALWLKELETYSAVPAASGPGELQPRPGVATDQAGQNCRSQRLAVRRQLGGRHVGARRSTALARAPPTKRRTKSLPAGNDNDEQDLGRCMLRSAYLSRRRHIGRASFRPATAEAQHPRHHGR